ncbi:unnamed protein product [Protopolystoma xenopodis]|uniref:LNR domain-containing protein n=1 Tax=Protopolystoma xenopodis TaxID=117903 RepID=A0A448XPX4_9PLAT|nr:unnamed protein product [Protopolystoma xenopodis]
MTSGCLSGPQLERLCPAQKVWTSCRGASQAEARPTSADCGALFSDGVCHEACNQPRCHFDGLDCLPDRDEAMGWHDNWDTNRRLGRRHERPDAGELSVEAFVSGSGRIDCLYSNGKMCRKRVGDSLHRNVTTKTALRMEEVRFCQKVLGWLIARQLWTIRDRHD